MPEKIQLSIPVPCHENWETMTPAEKGKYCNSCRKEVIDFSMMSDRQVAEFFKKPFKDNVCGRFMTDQLGREMEIPRKRIPWLKYFFTIALPAFFMSARASAERTQGKIKLNTEVKQKPMSKTMGTPVAIKCEKLVVGDTIVLPEVIVRTYPMALKGEVVIVAGMVARKPVSRTKLAKPIPIIPAISSQTSTQLFRMYPNPVPSGSSLTIECKQTEEGYYTLQLVNLPGQAVHQQEIWIDAEARILNITVPPVAAGSYFLVLTHKKSAKKFSEKIIIR